MVRAMLTRRSFLASAAIALKRGNVDSALALIDAAHRSGDVKHAALLVSRGATSSGAVFGNRDVFLIASITKPMTASAVMLLRDRNELQLSDPVRKFIPEFKHDRVTIRHLLTHTSGLPDMLPGNDALRARHAPLADFVAGACRVPLAFEPGAKVSYQSMGILLASEIAQRITKRPFRDFLKVELFDPLGMTATSLGLGGRRIEDTAPSQVPAPSNWDWNSPYWRDLGAPWGGAHSTAGDIDRLLAFFESPNGKVLKVETAREMLALQTPGQRETYGLGWRLGDGPSPGSFGHSGSTGTHAWCDPKAALRFVLLTSQPKTNGERGLLRRASAAAAGA